MNIWTKAAVLVIALSLIVPVGVLAKGEDQGNLIDKVIKAVDEDYIWKVVEDVCEFGSCDLGFRVAGTQAEYDTVEYIMDEMNEIGLLGVDTEPVPVHGWDFRSASLTVHSPLEMEIKASSFGGVHGTDGPLSGELVYVGSSYSSDYEGLDVEGKIVLSNWDGYNIWIDAVGMMAYLHGAKGLVVSNIDSIYGQGDYAYQCHDASWNPEWPPMIYIPKEYGFQIVDMLESGEQVFVTMESDIEIDYDATGYNTIAYIPGRNYGTPDDELIIVGDHHDAWFTGAGDDTSAIGGTLALAKAIMDTGYQPERTLVFTTHTAEEYGTIDVYFDWCVGAWYQITREHPEWAGKAVAYINLELQGHKWGAFHIQTPIDLYPFMCQVAEEYDELTPYGVEVDFDISTWNDGWTFTAEGVPGITTAAEGTGDYALENIYHTQLDNLDSLDKEYLWNCVQMNMAMLLELDQEPVIPYSFDARASHFFDTWNRIKVESTGADPVLVNQLDDAAKDFKEHANAWASAKDTVKEGKIDEVNKLLLEINRIVEDGCTAMAVWENTVYPHQQGLMDSFWIDNVISHLEVGSVDSAIKNLEWWVGQVWYYDYVDYEYYIYDATAIHTPDNWGEQVQLGEIVDTWDVIASLEEKISLGVTDYSEEIAMLLEDKEVALGNLESGMGVLLDTFTEANAVLEELLSTV